MTGLPEPLVGRHVELSKLDGFMLDTIRLLGSELVALSTGDEFKAAVLLWCRAWKQVPACSLPNDDRILASFAMVPPMRWKKVKAMALRGFVECSDGRLYHRVLAEDAHRAWEALERRRERTRAATEARKGTSQSARNDERNDGRHDRRDDERNVDRNDQRDEVPYTARDGTGRDGTVKKDQHQPSSSLPRDAADAPEFDESIPRQLDKRPNSAAFHAAGDAVLDAIGVAGDPRWQGNYGRVQAWITWGADLELDILPAIRAVMAKRNGAPPKSLNYFDGAVAEAHERRTRGLPSGAAEQPAKRRFGITYSDEKIAELERENAARDRAKGAA